MTASAAWTFDEGFRVLSYRFRIRTTSRACAELVIRALGECRNSDVGRDVPSYEFEDRAGDGPTARLSLDGRPVIRNGNPSNVFSHLIWLVMNDAVSDVRDLLVVHAGVVVAPRGGAIVLPAASGGGKTTLTAGLVRAGFAFLSDEMAAVDPASRRVLPVPRSLFVKPGTFEALEIQPPQVSPEAKRFLDGTWPITPNDLNGSVGEAAQVRIVVAPAYRAGSPTRLEPISRAEGLTELARHAFNLEAFGGADGVRLLGELLRSADCYRLAVGRLSEAVDAVAEVAAAASPL